MLIQKGIRTRMTRPTLTWSAAFLVGLVVVGYQVAVGAADTYRWVGELVSLDDDATAVTVTARVISREALADLTAFEPGDSVLIAWSGTNTLADGISGISVDDGAGLSTSDDFRLRATFVDADTTRQSMTFSVTGPTSALSGLQASTPGTWATVTSPHRPAHGPASIVAVDAYSATRHRSAGSRPADDETYSWQGELVSLGHSDDRLTIRSRVVSAAGVAAAADMHPGDNILVTWSGFEDRADGIRSVALANDSGLWGSDRFLLEAEFVGMAGQYLTYAVELPTDSVAEVRTMAAGTWATATSPHRPLHGTAPVTTVAAYAGQTDSVQAAGGSYRWHGELISLDTSGTALTMKSRIVSADGAAEVAGLDTGDPIVITWSGFEDRANGIRSIQPDSGLWGGDRFLLEATFVGTDPGRQYLTFQVEPPAETVSSLRALTAGEWATVTTSHRPDTGAVEQIQAYAPSRTPEFAGAAPAADDTYHWHGELVSLDDAGEALTVRSRMVSSDALSHVGQLANGDDIVITWSGFEDRADGIRAVARDDQSGLWGSDRFVLQAEFVATEGQYLTFSVEPPASDVIALRALTSGAWATVTSPHRPVTAADAVMAVRAYVPQPSRLAGRAPDAGETYRWYGELVALEAASGLMTVKSRVVSREGTASASDLNAGDAIVITWSGFDDRANGVRAVAADNGSGLWGSDRFLLQADFVEMDPGGRYLTFTVEPPADSVRMTRELEAGDWAIVTSPHRPMAGVESVSIIDAYDPALRARRYVWSAELVALDAAQSMVVASAPVEEHVFRYVNRFSEGDEVVLIWTPGEQDQVEAIRYLELKEQSTLEHGYVLPVEFVAADEENHRMTLKTKVPSRAVTGLADASPGDWIKVMSLFDQSGDTAAIMAVESSNDEVE
ncbi:MAG: hypothetical protein VYE68_02760 [Acidobacteriota bacterium]|nr:hypothetical protein [Acidobacteriota bacterium]